ncbi:MAG: hypothetical protein K2O14_03600, partial [Oscillospiraceae bacterium]|nr:hypothetical protein [Oscillospiraceae bacterium]
MTAKEYLKQYRALDEQIFEKTLKLKRLQERRGYSSKGANVERSSLPSDKVAKLAADIADTEEEIARLKMLKAEIESRVGSLPDSEHREVLRLRFMKGFSVVKTGEILHCSDETVYD